MEYQRFVMNQSNNQKFVTPPLHWLRAFEASARHLSFTNAATELFLTQSAVSKQVRLLESHLNTSLFLREHRSLRLTEAGCNYLPTVVRAFNSLEQGTRSFLGYSTEKNLHIKVNYSFATLWLSNYIDEFMDLFPEVKLTVSTALWEQDFSGSIADVEIHYGKRELFADHAVQLTQEKLFPVCSPTLAQRLFAPEDMAKERILDLTGIRDDWSYWASQSGFADITTRQHHYFGTFVFSVNMAIDSKGITLGQSSLTQPLLERGELCMPFDFPIDGRDHYFVQKNILNTPHPYANDFLDWIIEKAQQRNGRAG